MHALFGYGGVGFVIVSVFMVFTSCRIVSVGSLGVKTQWGAVTGDVLNPGLHFVVPVAQGIDVMSVQTHAYGSQHVEAASHDLQVVTTDVVLNYHLEPDRVLWIRSNLGPGYSYRDRIVLPAIQETVKATTAHFPAESLITERPKVKADIERVLADRLARYGVALESLNVTNFSFSDDFEHAIELKVVAEQRALQAKNDLERIKIEAQQQIESAKAQAESIRIRSEALAQNQRLVDWEAIQKWDGKLPQIVGGAVPFINVAGAGR